MPSHRHLAAVMVGLATLATSPADAQTGIFGSAQRSTYRSCAHLSASDICAGDDTDPLQAIIEDKYAGGLGQFGSADLDIDHPGSPYDAFAHSTVSRDEFLLPTVRGETRAGPEDRVNINAFGFQSYTWTGDVDTLFSLAGNLHVVDSGPSFFGGGYKPGGAVYDGYIAVWDPSILAGYTTPQDLVANLLTAPCDTAGVLGRGRIVGSLLGGEFSRTVTTSECSPGSLTLRPGQEILAVAGLRLPTNRGGWVDATHTFTSTIDPTLSAEVRAGLQRNLLPATVLPAVPEPSTWMMMILGFGAAAAAMRRRTRKLSLA